MEVDGRADARSLSVEAWPKLWKKAFEFWVNFWTKSSDKISCNLVSMITRLVSLAFAIIALILLLRKQFHALDIFSDLTKIYGLFNVSFLPFFKRVPLKALWKVCFDFERTGRIFDFDKTFLCFQNYQIWPFLWRNQLSLLRHRYFYPMGMPLREVESQTHYTGKDSMNDSLHTLVQFWETPTGLGRNISVTNGVLRQEHLPFRKSLSEFHLFVHVLKTSAWSITNINIAKGIHVVWR